MKKQLLFLLVCLLISYTSSAQTTLFFDDFESGTGSWTLTGDWGLDQDTVYNGANALTDSPNGKYIDQQTSYATMVSGVDLSNALDAEVDFWTIWDLEFGFDYMYLEASIDGGNNWVNVKTYNGEDSLANWFNEIVNLGGWVGNADVRLQFKFVTDQAYRVEGMWIDDFTIISDTVDNAPPLILHTETEMYEATLYAQTLTADFIDISGIAVADLGYSVDGGTPVIVNGVNTFANEYAFTIPPQLAGAWVDYWFAGTDASPQSNTVVTDTFGYISGNYIKYDNAQIDVVNPFGNALLDVGAAVRVSFGGETDLVTMLIRNYTDIQRPNDSMLVHVWDDNAGLPGNDMIPAFMVKPECTLAQPNITTRVDLRPFAPQLSAIPAGDYFIGFTVPDDSVWVGVTTTAVGNRTFTYNGFSWAGPSINDFHFRVITDTIMGAPIADFNWSGDPDVNFVDLSANSPTGWDWDFGDGSPVDNNQDPAHLFPAVGTYNVCLTAINGIGGDTKCQLVQIDSAFTPKMDIASTFLPGDTICINDCEDFFDLSVSPNNYPATAWSWSFPGGILNSSTVKNPTNICYNTAGTYDVYLEATNQFGTNDSTFVGYVVVVVCPGIEEQQSGYEISIYPHPLTDNAFIAIKSTKPLSALSLNLFNILGKKTPINYTVKQDGIEIHRNNLSTGLYIFEVYSGQEMIGKGKLNIQ